MGQASGFWEVADASGLGPIEKPRMVTNEREFEGPIGVQLRSTGIGPTPCAKT